MPLDATNFYPKGPVKSVDLKQFFDLFTGVMVDQPVVFSNVVTIGGNQGNTSVPLKLYGAIGQNTNLIDLYPDKTSPQPGFGFSASGMMAWGPGGTAPQDTFMSRIGLQNGHATDTAGVLLNPGLEVTGNLKVGGDITITDGELIGTITVPQVFTATQINLESSGAFIKAYDTDKTYAHISKLTVTPGSTSLAGVVVNGTAVVSGVATFNTQVNTPLLVFPGGANLRSNGGDRVRAINHLDIDYDLQVGRDLNVLRNQSVAGVLYSAREIVGGWDAGQVMNVNGNGFATGYWYSRSGTARCWDAADFSFSTAYNAASTLVQRDGIGQIAASGVYMPVAAVGGTPSHVIGQGGDGWMHWYPVGAIAPPVVPASSQTNNSWASATGVGGGGYQALAMSAFRTGHAQVSAYGQMGSDGSDATGQLQVRVDGNVVASGPVSTSKSGGLVTASVTWTGSISNGQSITIWALGNGHSHYNNGGSMTVTIG